MYKRIQLSGGLDHSQTQTVYVNNKAIGTVTPVSKTTRTTWEGKDNKGNSYGDMWLSPWYAAQAIVNGLGVDTETHKQHSDRVKPIVPCSAHHLTFGGECLNCGYDLDPE